MNADINKSLDVALTVSMNGLHLIEASAGTGKTFALCGLFLRAIVEQSLSPKNILVVTFTEAAAQELRERLRRRLQLAAACAAAKDESADSPVKITPTAEQIWVQNYLAQFPPETVPTIRKHLDRAILDLDEAWISTIHGFCHRLLKEYGWRTRLGGKAFELGVDENALASDMATRIRRELLAEDNNDLAAALLNLWPSVDDLAPSIRTLFDEQALVLPSLLPAEKSLQDSRVELRQRCVAFKSSMRDEFESACEEIQRGFSNKDLNGVKVKANSLARSMKLLSDWLHDDALLELDLHANRFFGAEFLKSATSKNKSTPRHRFFLAFDELIAAFDAAKRVIAQHATLALHRVRELVHLQLRNLTEQSATVRYQALIEHSFKLLSGETGAMVAADLAKRFPVILVDEFQDTDSQQWSIFKTIHQADDDHGMVLVGDPKQAIYAFRGGDLDAYLSVRKSVISRTPLRDNYRSTQALIDAIQIAYWPLNQEPFANSEIRFDDIVAAGAMRDQECRIQGQSIAPIRVWAAAPPEKNASLNLSGAELRSFQSRTGFDSSDAFDSDNADSESTDPMAVKSKQLLMQAVALEIAGLLKDQNSGGDASADHSTTRVHAKNFAVLVNTRVEAKSAVEILSRHKIDAVSLNRESVLQTAAACDWLIWLAAMIAPRDQGAVRAALATPLFECVDGLAQGMEEAMTDADMIDADMIDAAKIDAAKVDANAGSRLQLASQKFQAWSSMASKFGPVAVFKAMCDQTSNPWRIRAMPATQFVQWRQIAELMQAWEESASLERLQRCLWREMESDEGQDKDLATRLSDDTNRVQVMTMHASKGLEFDLVYLPWACFGGRERHARVQSIRFHRNGATCIRIHEKDQLAALEDEWEEDLAQAKREQLAERLRVLYVGMTRARLGVVLGATPTSSWQKTALGHVIGAQKGLDKTATKAEFGELLHTWSARMGVTPKWLDATDEGDPAEGLSSALTEWTPLTLQRKLFDHWRMHSFSALTAGEFEDSGDAKLPWVNDASARTLDLDSSQDHERGLMGNRFGRAVHGILERAAFSQWQYLSPTHVDVGLRDVIESALRAEAVPASSVSVGVRMVTQWLRDLSLLQLPEGAALCNLAPAALAPEFEFHFPLPRVAMDQFIDVLSRHGFEREAFSMARSPAILEGLMHGYIDLVYQMEGRFGVIDFKTNVLPNQDISSLRAAMDEHAYRLQGLIYLYALRRWLMRRLQADFDSARHLGAMNFVFLRGLPSNALYSESVSQALWDEMDALLLWGARS